MLNALCGMFHAPIKKGVTKKLLLIMRFTAIFLLAAAMQVSARGFSQQVNLSVKNASLQKVFAEIKKQTGYNFVYANDVLQHAKKVSFELKGITVDEALQHIFKNQPLAYSVVDKVVVVKIKEPTAPKELNPNETFLTTIDVSGKVTDAEGNPLAGASVKVKGTTLGTTTNADGSFIVKGIDENATLIFSYAEHETIELKVSNRTTITAALKRNDNPLDEIQVVAYGTKIKREQIGNVNTVNAKDIAKQPVSNPLLALAGRVPGLFITQSTGLPGSGVNVTVQGVNSINRGSEPFYVVDGVPYTSLLLPNNGSVLGNSGQNPQQRTSGNPLGFLNPVDIESISVLKDADATAIYGSRGANGVILITTKKGKSGQTRVDVNMQSGWGKVTRKLDLLNTQQYLEMRLEAKRNDNAAITSTDYDLNGLWDKTRNANWQKELIGNTAQYTDANVTISGGNANTQVLAGVGYHRETTVFPGNLSDQKGSLHFSINNLSTNQKFRFQLSGNYLEDNNRIISRDLTQDAIRFAPNAPAMYNEDGTLNWMPDASGNSTWDNPLAYLNQKYKNKTTNLIGSATISYQIIPGLDIKSSFGYTNIHSTELAISPLSAIRPEWRLTTTRSASYAYNNITSWVIEPHVNYKTKFGKSKLEALIGATIQQNISNGLRLSGFGYTSDIVLEDIKSASTISIAGNIHSVYKYNAIFTRLNYVLLDKYLVNLTVRRDGSSRFGPGNQFHNFGSAGIGWIFTKEEFFQREMPFLSFGKLSASYGITGNDQIGDYQFMTLYNPPSVNVGVPYQGVNGLQPFGHANAFLQWEETKKLHMGLDIGLFKERIFITANYFRNRSSNQLLNYILPIQAGFASIARNLPATVQNSGWEFSVSSTNINTKNFAWSTEVNLTTPKNQLLEFSNIETSGYGSFYVIGKPITITRVYQFAGVNPASGVYQFIDHKGNLTSSPDFLNDATVLINTSPTLYGGFKNTFRYKSLELDFLFQFVKRKGRNYQFGNSNSALINVNQPTSVLQRWQKPGDTTSIQRYFSNSSLGAQVGNASASDAGYSDASFARLKNISLSWKMPQSWYNKAKLKNVRLYIQGQNLLTITNYFGLDPETLSSTTLPPLKVFTIGLQVGL